MAQQSNIMEEEESFIYLMDDDDSVFNSMALLLSNIDVRLHFYRSAVELTHAMKQRFPHCLLIELNLQPDSGLDIYEALKVQNLAPPTIFLATYNDTSTAVQVMRAGAFDFIEKPFSGARLIKSLKQIIDTHQASKQ